MIRANELMINNWILDHEAESEVSIYWQVEEITEDGIKFREGSCWTKSDYIQPIPLTEEWLIKFGFEKYRNCFLSYQKIYEKSYIHFRIFNKSTISFVIKNRSGKDEYKLIESVHQLQNLYFALTGEQLTIKE